jgi:hypothetical protein
MPSHAQAARVAEGSLDLAICWVQTDDLDEHRLDARPVGADRLYAVSVGQRTSPVEAKDTVVLLDADSASWSSWNRYGEQFAGDTGAATVPIDDGGITGPTFFEHVRRLRRPVLNSPKGQTTPVPPDLVQRKVIRPTPMWIWSLVWRHDEDSPAVHAVVDALTSDVGPLDLGDDAWLPAGDPHRRSRA